VRANFALPDARSESLDDNRPANIFLAVRGRGDVARQETGIRVNHLFRKLRNRIRLLLLERGEALRSGTESGSGIRQLGAEKVGPRGRR